MTILSVEREISNIRWKRLATKPARVLRAVRVEKTVVFEYADGSYGSYPDISKYAYTIGRWPWQTNMLKALQKLGAVSAEAVTRHMADVEARAERSEKRFDLETLERLSKRWKFRLTAQQRKALGETQDD